MFWALRASDGTAVFLKAFNDAAGVARMDRARLACKERLLVCPDCEGTLNATSRSSSGRRAHFKHAAGAAADAACPGAVRMSMAHLRAQDNIAAVLRRGHPRAKVILEAVNIGEDGHAGRADIVVIPPTGSPLCIEVQASDMPVADLQARTAKRERDGYVVEWIFIVGRHSWPNPLPRKPMLRAVLDIRGYAYVLDDPRCEEPKLWIVVDGMLTREIPGLSSIRGLRGEDASVAGVLTYPRLLRDFTLAAGTPGQAGLRCHRLHDPVAGWMQRCEYSIAALRPRPLPIRTPAMDLWHTDQEKLERALARTDADRRAAQSAFSEANLAATAAAANAAEIRRRAALASTPREVTRRRASWLTRWWPARPRQEPPVANRVQTTIAAQAERHAAGAGAILAQRRSELAQCDAEHQGASEALARHRAARAAAEQRDEVARAESLRLAQAALDTRMNPLRQRVEWWQQRLPAELPATAP
jgi:hypothetical protein